MTITAKSIIQRASDTLQDSTSVRWPVPELVRYLNDAQREVVMYRPDATVTNSTVTLAAGTRQHLPTNGAKLIEVVRNNTNTTQRSVRMVNREILDAQIPTWHNVTPSDEVLHFMYDPRDPKVFYVYPPATTTAALDIVYSVLTTDITEPAEGSTWDAVTGNVSLPDIYSNALVDYVLYRAYAKDSEYAGNAGRATAHYSAFANALGIEMKATVNFQPSTVGNPNKTTA
jgi:hypothetical protein